MSPALIAAIALLPLIAWRIVRTALAWLGDRSPAAREDALKYFSPEEIDRGRMHTRAYLLPGLARTVPAVALLWALIFLSLAGRMESAAESVFSSLPLQAGCFLAIYVGVYTVVFAPLEIYSGYVLGRRLGTLRQTFAQWLGFQAKGLAVNFLLTWIVLSVFVFLVRALPGYWWVIAATVLTLFVVLLVFLQPILLAPVFHRFSRLGEGPLRDRLLGLCREAGVEAYDVFVQHESKVSTRTNAYFTGVGGSRRIVLFDNLLDSHSPDEIAVIVTHEAGHWSHGHIFIGIVLSAASIFAGSFVLHYLFGVRGVEEFFGTSVSRLSVLPVITLLAMLASVFIGPCASAVSRIFERQADATALKITRAPDAFISAQVRLVRDNNIDVLPHPLLVRLYASHPTALQRIRFATESSKNKTES
jgi:STE24 endopeptidase